MTNATIVSPRSPLTGAKVLLILVGFFGVTFAVDGLMSYDALVDLPRRGRRTILMRRAWPITTRSRRRTRRASAIGRLTSRSPAAACAPSSATRKGAPIDGLAVSGVFAAPADMMRDRPFVDA